MYSWQNRNTSGHTDTLRDWYVDELIEFIKQTNPREKKKKEIKETKERSFRASGVDIYAGVNGSKKGGWIDVEAIL